ncbi:MAG: purine-nucleoside phosphorylase [Desulfovibrio sp.]|jgi:purine-nucleoside phosphorylase|nr:purine-nucleoside phosphorylase [Desulfovibrio sp.]
MQNAEKVQNCARTLQSRLPRAFRPDVGLVLGTGLGGVVEAVDDPCFVPYTELPDFPVSGAPSHQGRFVAGRISGVPVLVQQGRCHLYEGRTAAEVAAGVRVTALCGAGSLIVANAAGALNPRFECGTLMLIDDHINCTGASPLTGPAPAGGLRFPDMSRAYDPEYLRLAGDAALRLALRLEKGVYVGVAGPQWETRAETRLYRMMGGDAVGMSTVVEVIAAVQAGLRVLGISCLTNRNLPDCMVPVAVEEVIAAAERAGADLCALLRALLPRLRCSLSG